MLLSGDIFPCPEDRSCSGRVLTQDRAACQCGRTVVALGGNASPIRLPIGYGEVQDIVENYLPGWVGEVHGRNVGVG